MPGQGQQGHVGVGRETTWGTPVAVSSGDFIEAFNESLTLARERFETKNIIARITEPQDTAGLRRIEGDFLAAAHPVSIGHLLNMVFGQGSRAITVVLSGFLWTLDWMPAPSDFSSLSPLVPYTWEIFRDVTSAHRYAGVNAGRGEFALAVNQALQVGLGLIGKTTSIVAKSTATFPASSSKPFTWDSASLSVGGAAADLIESFTIAVDNQLEGIPTLNNTDEVGRIRRRGAVLVRVNGAIAFDNLTEYNNFLNQTAQKMTLSLTKADSFQLVYDMPQVVFSEFPLGIPGRERLTVAFNAIAEHHTGSGTPIKVSLTTVKSNF